MSRVAKQPITVPAGVSVAINRQTVTVKGSKGEMVRQIHPAVKVSLDNNVLSVEVYENSRVAWAQAGTTRALLNNMVIGVSAGFERKLTLVGVGFRAKAQGQALNLIIGYSHPVDHHLPKGISVETPTQTDIVLKSSDKQLLGQMAAEIRAYRPPEPYKGKGIRYSDEVVTLKETKKK